MVTYSNPVQPRGNAWLGAALGVVAGLVILGLAWFALGGPASAQPVPSPSVAGTPTPTRSSAAATPTATASATPTGSASADVPGIVRELAAGSWVTVLDSLPQQGTTPQAALTRAAALSRDGFTASPVDTNAIAGLNPGFYAIAVTGLGSQADAYAVCDQMGVPRGARCYPREIQGAR
mgnify:FL=1